MALKEQDIVFTTTDEAGNTVIQMPITRVENVEGAVRTVNSIKPDNNGDVKIDIDMSHLATKEEVTQGLSKKREHTIQIANADLNTLLEDKTWACSGTLKNTPIACTFCIVQAYDTGAPISGNIVQVCYIPNQTDNTVRTFTRNCLNGLTFGKWTESGAVKTVNSIAPDASGEVTLPNATTSKAGLVRLAAEEDVLNEAPQTAVCTQLIYEINEFRRKSTAYQVGDKVDCAFQYERFLECTKAGTTSGEFLDTRNVTHGQVITDGTAEWTVRTHIRSINNAVADASGNITPAQTGCLPLMGGTLTGHLVVEGMSVEGTESSISTDDPAKELMLTTGDRDFRKSGGYLTLYGREHQNNGGFSLSARNVDFTEGKPNDHSLIGNAAGNLTWENQEIERVASSGTNFIRFASGLQICFGYTTEDASNYGVRVTYQAPFNALPNIVTQYWADKAIAHTSYVRLPETSGFTLHCTTNNFVYWIAIGFWK